jgi:hypothetical protein
LTPRGTTTTIRTCPFPEFPRKISNSGSTRGRPPCSSTRA